MLNKKINERVCLVFVVYSSDRVQSFPLLPVFLRVRTMRNQRTGTSHREEGTERDKMAPRMMNSRMFNMLALARSAHTYSEIGRLFFHGIADAPDGASFPLSFETET